jgi:hypothetical protein
MKKSNDGLKGFLYKVLGLVLMFAGSVLFYEGFSTIVLTRIGNDPVVQFITGTLILAVAYVVFDRKVSLIK